MLPAEALTCIDLKRRHDKYSSWINTINRYENGLDSFSQGYLSYGFQTLPNGDVTYREWAPGAETAALIGDFSERLTFADMSSVTVGKEAASTDHHASIYCADGWNRSAHLMTKNSFGVFEIVVSAVDGKAAIPHNSKVKVSLFAAVERACGVLCPDVRIIFRYL